MAMPTAQQRQTTVLFNIYVERFEVVLKGSVYGHLVQHFNLKNVTPLRTKAKRCHLM
jgi:hypothetical protein